MLKSLTERSRCESVKNTPVTPVAVTGNAPIIKAVALVKPIAVTGSNDGK